MEAIGAAFGLGLIIFSLILTIAFILLPFIVMGTNSRLDKVIEQTKILNESIHAISQQLDYIAKKGPTEARPKVEEKR